MLNTVKVSLKDSLIYGLGNIAVKIIGFILIPLYTDPKYFSIDDFGVIALLDISGLVLISLMASALPQSLMRWYWDKEHIKDQKQIFFMTLSVQVLVSLLFIVLTIPLTGRISTIIFGTEKWSFSLRLLILSTALQAINNIINTLMRVQSKSLLFTAANILKLLTVLSLTLFFIVHKKMGVPGIYLAQVTGNLLFIIFLSGYTAKNCVPSFNFKVLRSMTMFGFPLMLANFAGACFSAIDRYSLNSMALLKFVALYSLAFKVSSVLRLVIVDSIKMAISPMIIRKIDDPDNMRFYSKTNLYSSFVLMFGVIAISLFSYEAIKIMSRSTEFWEAYLVVPLLSISVFFVNMRETTGIGLTIKKRTWIIGIIVILSSIINILLNIMLIPRFNIYGAASATIFTNIFYWLACYYFSQKAFFIPYELSKIFLILITGTLLSLSGLLISEMELFPRLILKILILISFPFILYILKFYEPAEMKSIKGFIIKWSNIRNLGVNLKSVRKIGDDI